MLLSLLSIDGMLLGSIHIFLAEEALDLRGDLVMYNCLVIFADNIDAEFLVAISRGRYMALGREHTTMSSVLSSKGGDSMPSWLRRAPLIKVPFEDLTSLIKI